MSFPDPNIIQPVGSHTHSIIFIHGRDSDGEELAEQLFEGKLSTGMSIKDVPAMKGYKWIFPSAHERISTVFQEELTEWFDIYSLTNTDSEQERQIEGLRESIQHIHSIIDDERKVIPTNRIVLAGISQGFAIASHVLLSSQHDFAGFIGLCGWIPFQNELRQILEHQDTLTDLFTKRFGLKHSTANPPIDTPLFIGHAKDDEVVDFQHGVDACDTLQRFGMSADFRVYEGKQHWVCGPQGHDDLASFLSTLLSSD